MAKTFKHIVEKAAEYSNVSDSFDYEMRGKRKNTRDGRWITSHRELVIKAIQSSIIGGTLRPGTFHDLTVKERGKVREAQCISLLRSIAIHAVMRVVEDAITPAFIADSAASIKGRGGQYLLRRMLHDLRNDKEGCKWVYKDDIRKFYQSIPQEVMIDVVYRTFRDKKLRRILERWITMLPVGMSIGMRPSQGLANLLLSIYIDHVIKDNGGFKHYKRYCDDRVLMHGNPMLLTHGINVLKDNTKQIGLDIKSNSQVWKWEDRPVDFLGYITFYDGNIRIRKHIKQRFARKWKTVKSSKRKRELIGSFYGIAKHGKCRHLFRKLTGLNMTSFAEAGFVYQRDGKKDFSCPKVSVASLLNVNINIVDFETGIKTREGEDRYIVLVKHQDGREQKFFTASDKMKKALDFMRDKGLIPFQTVIKPDNGCGYIFT